MEDAELTRLIHRFGDDASRWPAPHRREAALHLSPDPRADAVLHAALMQPTDEAALAGYGALLLVFGGIGYGGNPGSGGGTGDPLLALAFGDALPALAAAP